MKRLKEEVTYFCRSKVYVLLVLFCALAAYGFTVSHAAVGIDDTVIELYFEKGLAPAVGRWCIYLIGKILKLSSFAPWITELAAVLILCLSVTLWCILFRRVAGEHISIWGYAFFAGCFLSSPIISEVFVYYLHNGICIGYGVTALSLMALLNSMCKDADRKQRGISLGLAVVGMLVSIGFYESFLIVYAIGAVLLYFLIRVIYPDHGRQGPYESSTFCWCWKLGLTGAVVVILRPLVLSLLELVFRFEIPDNYAVGYRSVFENLGLAKAELFMVLKKFWVMYYVNGIVYLPVAVAVAGLLVLFLYAVVRTVRTRDFMLLFAVIVVVLIPIMMCIIEGYPTHYRSAQYIPLLGAFGVLLLFLFLGKHRFPKGASYVAGALLCVLLYNQCADMNQWFYIDYLKYQDALNTMRNVAYELEKGYDTAKPIVFRGSYMVPYEIAKDAYVSFSSRQFGLISQITDLVDVHLKEKFYAEDGHGYVFAETPINSTLRWGVAAFDGTSTQLIEFWKMHGYSFTAQTDLTVNAQAEEIRKNMPAFPKEGSILDCGEYIIVNLGE